MLLSKEKKILLLKGIRLALPAEVLGFNIKSSLILNTWLGRELGIVKSHDPWGKVWEILKDFCLIHYELLLRTKTIPSKWFNILAED